MQGGVDLPVRAILRDGTAFSWVRDLAAQFGGVVAVDDKQQLVTVTRKVTQPIRPGAD